MVKSFKEFMFEKENFEDKIKGHGYFKGISTSTARKKASQMKDQAKMGDDNPDAYKPLPGDTKGKKLLKPSVHTKNYQKLYGDKNESLEEYFAIKIEEGFSTITVTGITPKIKSDLITMGADVKMSGPGWYIFVNDKDKSKILNYLNKSGIEVNENLLENASGDRSPIDNKDIETALKKKSEETGVPIPLLRIIMRRGMAAWRSGHRPGAGQEQWGYARLSSFLTKAPGTWGRPINDPQRAYAKDAYGADSDVAQEVIKGGYDKNLKEA